MPHRRRDAVASRFPVHVTLKLVREVRGLHKLRVLPVFDG